MTAHRARERTPLTMKASSASTLLVLLLLAPGCATKDPGAAAVAQLHDIFDREWQVRLEENPLTATSVGVHDYDDRLPSVDPEDLERRDGQWRAFLAELDGVDRAALPESERIDLDIFRTQLEDRVAGYRFGAYQIPFNADSGFYSGFARLGFNMPFDSTEAYENYLARLAAWPRYVDQHIGNMRIGLERGMTQPKVVLTGIDDVIAAQIVDDPESSVFYRPFAEFPVSVPPSEHERLRAAAREVISQSIVPGYRKLRDFMVDEYIPSARYTLGASELPDGRDYYRQNIRHFTTLDLTPEEIHQTGLDEVARIRAEMEAIVAEVGFHGTFAEFLEFLRTDPRFYPKTPEELLKDAAYIAKTMDGKLPALFKTLPRLPYTVEPVPDDIAPKYTSGRYVGPPEGSTQPGRYWVNTYALDTRPLYNLEALTLHEAVPGHHLQGALSSEQGELPNFRRYSYLSAFGEGWGLYSEWLGLEAGFYKDPYSNFGRLTYEMWRACRLVVDTGVHAMGWTRQQMMDYMAANTALSLHEITTETDRYISWPAQALSYKIGQLKLLELRRKAEKELGPKFDVRLFHDAVLVNGSIPLDVLERQIDHFITEQKATP
jgi:uncharacterized protein (DUF885 family)